MRRTTSHILHNQIESKRMKIKELLEASERGVAIATAKSAEANAATKHAKDRGTHFHAIAAKKHGSAEMAQRAIGNKKLADEHKRMAQFHHDKSI